jgi:hypothetical protein
LEHTVVSNRSHFLSDTTLARWPSTAKDVFLCRSTIPG